MHNVLNLLTQNQCFSLPPSRLICNPLDAWAGSDRLWLKHIWFFSLCVSHSDSNQSGTTLGGTGERFMKMASHKLIISSHSKCQQSRKTPSSSSVGQNHIRLCYCLPVSLSPVENKRSLTVSLFLKSNFLFTEMSKVCKIVSVSVCFLQISLHPFSCS